MARNNLWIMLLLNAKSESREFPSYATRSYETFGYLAREAARTKDLLIISNCSNINNSFFRVAGMINFLNIPLLRFRNDRHVVRCGCMVFRERRKDL